MFSLSATLWSAYLVGVALMSEFLCVKLYLMNGVSLECRFLAIVIINQFIMAIKQRTIVWFVSPKNLTVFKTLRSLSDQFWW